MIKPRKWIVIVLAILAGLSLLISLSICSSLLRDIRSLKSPETVIMPIIALVVFNTGLVLIYAGYKRGREQILAAGAGVFILSIGLFAVAKSVNTSIAANNFLEEKFGDRELTEEEITEWARRLTETQTNKPVQTITPTSTEETYNDKNIVSPELGNLGNPIIISASEFATALNADIDAAGATYNDKWVQITGEVTQVVDGGGMTGYYLYGKRGDSGLRIMCWCDGGVYQGVMVGHTFTFVGQVREVTTLNVTEIGACEIISG